MKKLLLGTACLALLAACQPASEQPEDETPAAETGAGEGEEAAHLEPAALGHNVYV